MTPSSVPAAPTTLTEVNNVLCFPFIFRGALDVGATAINEEMKLAAVHAIAELAHAEQSEVVASAYGDQGFKLWSGVHHSETIRPAADRQDRPPRWRRRRWTPVWRRARSLILTPISRN